MLKKDLGSLGIEKLIDFNINNYIVSFTLEW